VAAPCTLRTFNVCARLLMLRTCGGRELRVGQREAGRRRGKWW
jgi:hypothetical protein